MSIQNDENETFDRVAQIGILDGYVRDMLDTAAYDVTPGTDVHELAVFLTKYHIENSEDLPGWFGEADRTYMIERFEASLSDQKAQAEEDED
ncbi:MAG TPA: hypothetical protein PKD09_09495 [Aggregatilinea sp.]|uniref:hypothetical protein n=1 Tax=Aggregatilinea sp. TaxID=2806333 RepID=UPI002C7E0721|nr:hypothetical protein [Aggregatilinea sp.]HML21871.1 hypothetical protein [Aggregatilinea sp.]